MKKDAPIAIFDSGSGGLTVFKYLEALLPHESFLYLGDLAHFPYGEKSPEALNRYSLANGKFLESLGAKLLIIGCNTATGIALPSLQQALSIPVIGIIEPCAKKIAKVSKGRVGLIATPAMIRSGQYEKTILKYSPEVQLISESCPTLAYLVEQQLFNHPATPFVIEAAVKKFRQEEIDTFVIGCSHYFLILDHLRKALGESVTLLDPAEACAEEAALLLKKQDLLSNPSSLKTERFFTSAWSSNFREIAPYYLGRPINDPEHYCST